MAKSEPSPSNGSDSWRSRARQLKPGTRKVTPESAVRDSVAKKPDRSVPESTASESNVLESNEGAPAAEFSVPSSWQPIDAGSAFEPSSSDQPADQENVSVRRRGRMSWVEWTGLAVVLTLLVAAYAATLSRPEAESAETSNRDGAAKPVAIQMPSTQPADPRVSQVVDSEPNRPAENPSLRPSVVKVVDEVLGAAGDGSFSLGMGEQSAPQVESTAAEKSPPKKPDRSPETKAAKRTANKPLKAYPPAPSLRSIIPIADESDRTSVVETAPATPLRAEIRLPPFKPASVSFDRIYAEAFQSHQEYVEAGKADSQSRETVESLRRSIELFRQCLSRPNGESSATQRWQIQYTLAVLYRDAGRLYESAVFANHVASFADVSQPTSSAAVSLAFAVLQEAHLSGYGNGQALGELAQITRLLERTNQRKLSVDQLDAMWYSTAQLYEQAGRHVLSAQCYGQVPKQSKWYAQAQLAAGRQLWAEVLRREKRSIESQRVAIESAAAKYLSSGIEAMESDRQVSATLLAGKISRAKIAVRREDPETAIDLLDGPGGVLDQLKQQPKSPESFATEACETLVRAYRQNNDFDSIRVAADRLAALYGDQGKERIAAIYRGMTKDLLGELEQIHPLQNEHVDQVQSMMDTLLDSGSEASTDLSLWWADVWTGLADNADQKAIRSRCLSNADRLLLGLDDRPDLSEAQKLSLKLKRIELAKQLEDFDTAIEMVAEILSASPTAIDLQFTAAELLVERGRRTGQSGDFAEAIMGRSQTSIWGWAKLANTLVKMYYDADEEGDGQSDSGSRSFQRMMRSALALDETRLLQAEATAPGQQRQQLLRDAASHLRQLKTTFAADSPIWKQRIESLEASLTQL